MLTRVKKTIDYITEMCSSKEAERQTLGKKLEPQCVSWTETLNLTDFLMFNKNIQRNKTKIGVDQYFGKFRAYAFEEYVYRLIRAEILIPPHLQLFCGEKCLVWRRDGKEYGMEFDVSIGRRTEQYIQPVMIFETKVELDSTRLKTALASVSILKKWSQKVKCFLVYPEDM